MDKKNKYLIFLENICKIFYSHHSRSFSLIPEVALTKNEKKFKFFQKKLFFVNNICKQVLSFLKSVIFLLFLKKFENYERKNFAATSIRKHTKIRRHSRSFLRWFRQNQIKHQFSSFLKRCG